MLSRRDILKISRKKHAHKRHAAYLFVGGISTIVCVLFLVGVGLLSGWERIGIHDIVVAGNSIVHTEDIVREAREELNGRYFFLFRRNNIFIYPEGRIARRLMEKFKRIAEIDIRRNSLTDIRIAIVEYEPKYLWCGDYMREDEPDLLEACYFSNENGYIFSKAPDFSGNVFFKLFGPLSGGGVEPIGKRFLAPLAFTKLILFRDVVAGYGGEVVKFAVTEKGDHIFILNNGSRIIFGADQDFDTLTGNLSAVSATLPQNTPIEYIDLRYGNKVFFKEKKE